MSSYFMGRYRLRVRKIFGATAVLVAAFLFARHATLDVLTLGYAMIVPVFVFLSVLLDDARPDKRDLRSPWVWFEVTIPLLGAAGVGCLGYRLWLLGF